MLRSLAATQVFLTAEIAACHGGDESSEHRYFAGTVQTEETHPASAGPGSDGPRFNLVIYLAHCMPRCLVGDASPGQPVTGETDRPRKSRSMEGRRGLRRLTGQKAEPPCGVKLTLLGSGQDGCRRGSS